MICEKCRMKLSDDMKFCPVCGTAVSKSKESKLVEARLNSVTICA
jgi:RNA polymerase subunit RPABC4/transcription elongation factor Spt4